MIFITNEREINFFLPQLALYFYRSNMVHHAKYVVALEHIEQPNNQFFAIDFDVFWKLCRRWDFQCLPAIILMKNNKMVKRIEGYHSTAKLADIYQTEFNNHGAKHD